MRIRHSLSIHLLRNFLISTLVPFMLVTSFIAHFYSKEYSRDVRLLLDSAVISINSNLTTYLGELEQATLQPYYNDSLYDYLWKKSKGHTYDILDEIPLRNNLDSCFKFIRFSRTDINGIFIVNEDSCLYYTTNNYDQTILADPIRYGQRQWYRDAVAADGRCILLNPHTPDFSYPSKGPVISLIRSIVTLKNRTPLYVIKIDINTSIFDRILKDVTFHVPSRIIIRDESQQIIYTNTPLSPENRQALSGPITDASITLDQTSYRPYSYPLEKYPWTITVLLSEKDLKSRTHIIYLTALLVYLIGVVTAAFSYLLTSKKMVASIDSIKEVFAAIQKRDFSKKYGYTSNTELDDLGDFLNQTAEQLEKTIEREYVLALKQKDSEFRALQAQIQPHFLFNTLNNFIALNQLEDRETLETSLYALSEMLRYILKAPSLIPLSSELKFIDEYCALQKLRFNDRLTYQIDCTPLAEPLLIPKLLIQPVIENSILHGIEPCSHPCHIQVNVTKQEPFFVVTIHDDGTGFDLDSCPKDSIGLSNIRERLRSYSPGSYMTMESSPGNGTTTVIFLEMEVSG